VWSDSHSVLLHSCRCWEARAESFAEILYTSRNLLIGRVFIPAERIARYRPLTPEKTRGPKGQCAMFDTFWNAQNLWTANSLRNELRHV
jgi:hypothetical protein